MKIFNKLAAIALAIMLIISAIPLGAFTFTASAATSGYYTYTTSNGAATITDCDNSISGSVTIPSTLGGYPVTSIGECAFDWCTRLASITIPDSVTSIESYAFYNCTRLTSVSLGNSVTSIGDYAFSDCTSLTSITIPDSVTSIASDAFYNCTSLTSVTIGNSVTSIGDYAFSDCTSLTTVSLGDSVTSIGDRAFSGCTRLTAINVDENNGSYCSVDGVLFNKDKTTLIQYPAGKTGATYIIPDSVTSIGDYAFSNCTSLTSITIPDSVTSIGQKAFENCEKIVSIKIPSLVTEIGTDAFAGCTGLKSVVIDDFAAWCNIGFANANANPLSCAHNLYLGNTMVTDAIVPESVTAISDYAFYGNTSLKSILIPDTVTQIGVNTFGGCNPLIKGYTGTYAEEYANYYGISFEALPEIRNIEVNTLPNKTTLCIGDAFDSTGLTVKVTDRKGNQQVLSEGFAISGFDSTTAGIKTVTVEYNGFTTTFTVVVETPSIQLSSGSKRMYVGETAQLKTNTLPEAVDVVWSSSDNDVATVVDGKITALREGTVNIVARFTYNGVTYSDTCEVTVSKITVDSISIYSNPNKTDYYVGDSFDVGGLEIKVWYNNDTTEIITTGFNINNSESITASAGIKTVTVEYGRKTVSFTVNVTKPEVELSQESTTMVVGRTATILATTTPSGQSITWTSSDDSVATVVKGVITARSAGTAIITASFTYNGIQYSQICKVAVESPQVQLKTISVSKNPNKTVYEVGEAFDSTGLELLAEYSDGTKRTVTSGFTTSGFSSETAGVKTIIVTYGGVTASFDITVNAAPVVDEKSPVFVAQNATACAGDVFTVSISTKNNPGIVSLKLMIGYDANVLELIAINGKDFEKTSFGPLTANPIAVNWFDTINPNNTTNGDVAILTFRVKDGVQPGDTAILISYDPEDVYNSNFENVTFVTQNGVVSIVDYISGDVNGDKVVNNKDLGLLMQYLNGWNVNIVSGACDVTGDNLINNKDLGILMQYLNGWNVELK